MINLNLAVYPAEILQNQIVNADLTAIEADDLNYLKGGQKMSDIFDKVKGVATLMREGYQEGYQAGVELKCADCQFRREVVRDCEALQATISAYRQDRERKDQEQEGK